MKSILFDTACEILRGKGKRRTIKARTIEGEIRTNFAERSLCGMAGVEFYADVETELGKGFAKYIVRPREVETRNHLEWSPDFTCTEDLLDYMHILDLVAEAMEVRH